MVLKEKIDYLPLLGRASLPKLGMLKIEETGSFREPNKMVQNTHPELEKPLTATRIFFKGSARQRETARKYRYTYQSKKMLYQSHRNLGVNPSKRELRNLLATTSLGTRR